MTSLIEFGVNTCTISTRQGKIKVFFMLTGAGAVFLKNELEKNQKFVKYKSKFLFKMITHNFFF